MTRARPSLPPDLGQLFESGPTVQEVLGKTRQRPWDPDNDPEFQAGYARSCFVQDVLSILQEWGWSKSDLARASDMTRQQLNGVLGQKPANLTIQTAARIAAALHADLMIGLRERLPSYSVTIPVEPPVDTPETTAADISARLSVTISAGRPFETERPGASCEPSPLSRTSQRETLPLALAA